MNAIENLKLVLRILSSIKTKNQDNEIELAKANNCFLVSPTRGLFGHGFSNEEEISRR